MNNYWICSVKQCYVDGNTLYTVGDLSLLHIVTYSNRNYTPIVAQGNIDSEIPGIIM